MHHILQFLWNGKPHPRCVLDDRDSFIRDVEEVYGRAQDAPAADNVGIEDICFALSTELRPIAKIQLMKLICQLAFMLQRYSNIDGAYSHHPPIAPYITRWTYHKIKVE